MRIQIRVKESSSSKEVLVKMVINIEDIITTHTHIIEVRVMNDNRIMIKHIQILN